MNRERFIQDRRDDWQQLESLLTKLKSVRPSRWQSLQISTLARLYRSICYDLSLVQSREWGVRLEAYLNDLVAQGHNLLYQSQRMSLREIYRFFAYRFPQLFRQRSQAILLSTGLFLVPLIISTMIAARRPDLAQLVVGSEQVQQTLQHFGSGLPQDEEPDFTANRSAMFGFYIKNNTAIALRAFALGALAGIGTCVILISNGISIGMLQGVVLAAGNPTAENFFSFIISHGAFELTAIVIAGAGGLVLAQGFLMPGTMSRPASVRHHGADALRLASGAAVMLFVAALLEGYFSPLPVAAAIKYFAGTFLWLIVLVYLLFSGRRTNCHES